MKQVLLLDKKVGETPLACLDRFRERYPEYKNVKMTYAGRLDPIASGLLVILVGDAVHRKDEFTKLSKTYECVAILGVATDTYDVLGIPVEAMAPLTKESWHETLRVTEALESFIGTFQQAYPPYSSKTVDGKQLHQIAREGNISSLTLPVREVTVTEMRNIEFSRISRSEIREKVTEIVSHVKGDFRQDQTLNAWNAFSEENPYKIMTIVSFTISVSSGTYIRGIVNTLGEKLGIGACIISLKRIKLGNYTLDNVDKF